MGIYTAVPLSKTSVGLDQVDNTSDATKNSATATLTNKTIDGDLNTLQDIPQSAVTGLGTALSGKVDTSAVGATGGVASLDGNGKVPGSQLPNSIMTYEGLHDVSANSPSLTDATGEAGQVYRVSVAGSRNYGSGSLSLEVGDYLIHSGSVWQKADTTDAVASVNGYTGNVSLSKSDVGLGNVDNTSDAAKNSAAVALTNKDLTSATNTFPTSLATVGLASTVTNGGTTTMTASSPPIQVFTTGTGGHTLNFPSTGVPAGMTITVNNRSGSGSVTINSTAGGSVGSVPGGYGTQFTALVDNPTAYDWTLRNPVYGTNGFLNLQLISPSIYSATLTTPKIGQILDTNGNVMLDMTAASGATNYFSMVNAAGGSGPMLKAVGSGSTNLPLRLIPKGTGTVNIQGDGSQTSVGIAAVSAATDVSLNLTTKGTGVVQANGVQVADVSSAQTLTNKTISGSSNTLSNIGVSSLSATGTPSSTTYLRGDGTWATPAGGGGGGSGDVASDTATSVDSEVALFSGTGGKTIKRATGSGVAVLTSGVLSTVTAPTGGLVGTTDTQSLSNKTLTAPTITDFTESVQALGTLTSSATLSLTNGTVITATRTPGTALTFTMPTAVAGKSFTVYLRTGASTSTSTVTFTGVKWGAGGTPIITSTANRMDIFSFVSDGTNWYGTASQGYTP